MINNATFSIFYYVFCFGAERKFTHSEMITFFEESTSYTLSTVMHVMKEVEIHDGIVLSIPIYDRQQPLSIIDINHLFQLIYVGFYDKMYIDYFNDVYNQNFIPSNADIDIVMNSLSVSNQP